MHTISIQPVLGGFIVSYPKKSDTGSEYVHEVCTSAGKAIRIAKVAVEEFSMVTKTKEDPVE